VELRQLKYFITVAETLHFGRAAAALHLSQPALSKQIQALEENLDVQLLERTKQWVKLTPVGQKFLEISHQILQDVEAGIQITKQIAAGQIGQVRIGITEATLFSLAPKILSLYRSQYPHVKLHLVSGGTEAHVEALRSHRIDIGFVYLPIREPSLAIHPLFDEVYVAALPAHHRLARQQHLSLASLANEPLIFYPRSLAPVLFSTFVNHCEQAGFVPTIVQEAELAQTRLGLVAAGVGIAFVLADVQDLSAKGVVYRPLMGNFLTLKLALSWRQTEDLPVVQTCLEELKNLA
jgi:DNA-binding transcriptional LysR family regulator